MERIRRLLKPQQVYEPLDDGSGDDLNEEAIQRRHFSRLEYYIFLLLGVSMLWAWNMFLAASPYFQYRLSRAPSLLSAYSPTLLTISTSVNLFSVIVLTRLQSNAHYPNRIILSLILNTIAFALLALSTVLFRSVSPAAYFGFLMTMVALASAAAGFCQNGVLAYVAAFNMPQYIQAIMTGQAIAGVLPCVAQIISVLAVPSNEHKGMRMQARDEIPAVVPQESGKSAFAYFLTAIPISVLTLIAFTILLRRHPDTGKSPIQETSAKPSPMDPPPYSATSPDTSPLATAEAEDESPPPARKSVNILTLYRKLHWLANAVFITFTLAMFFPVFTQTIHTSAPPPLPRLLRQECFIPLAFLLWNTGDLIGRSITALSIISTLTRFPKTIFAMSIGRVVWIPLYSACRSGGVRSDAFYLLAVQLGFGLGNGVLGSLCMMGAGEYVLKEEREVAGGFMGLMLVAGLSVGSVGSFFVM